MTKNIVLATVATAILLALTACSGKLKPMSSNLIQSTPQPLELVGSKVPVTINANFPAKWFNKNAQLTVKPILRYQGGETMGPSFRYQGEKVMGNEQVISYKNGGNVVMKFDLPYKEQMAKSELYLSFDATIKGKRINLPDVKVGDGVIVTEALATALNVDPALAPDAFQRIIKNAYDANIMFLIQQAQIRSKEMSKGEVKDWKNLVANANEDPRQEVSVEIQAYASPDGGVELNEKLSAERERNTNKALKSEFAKSKIQGVDIDAHYTAQDWEGFKQLVEKSDIQDKELVLRVLSMYPDAEQREREIKNISMVFRQLADEVLPQLRRSRLIANVKVIGKSDEEIKNFVAQKPAALNVEELLYAATLTSDKAEQQRIYQRATQQFPNDYRAYNNLGMLAYQNGDLTTAENFFNKAAGIKENPESAMNLGLLELNKGNQDKATEFFGSAAQVPEIGQALGLLYLKQGDYARAVQAFGNSQTNNAAIAHLLSNDYSRANQVLDAIANPDATTHYIKAIVAARTNNIDATISNLRQSIRMDHSMMRKAMNDLEFAKYASNAAFKALQR